MIASLPPGTATGIGSVPGLDAAEAARVVIGELPDLPHVPELPARGVGADMIGRAAGLLVDLAVETVPSGYRVAARAGREHRRAHDLVRGDLDALEEARERAGATPAAVKIQVAGPWTLAAGVELRTGHTVLTDRGAVREFTESLGEGLRGQIADLGRRFETPVVVQLDEPSLPTVLAGGVRTPSGYGTVPAVPENDAVELLRGLIDSLGAEALVHCCAPKPPLALLRRAGVAGIAIDAGLLAGSPRTVLDELGETLDADVTVLLGLVPSTDPATPPTLVELARPALELVDRLGFDRAVLATGVLPTPACGLAGAGAAWARRALTLSRELGRAFVEPPESW